MTRWLDPVARALDRRSTAVDIFVRDDDAGWFDQQLLALLDVFGAHGFPIDLAAIPQAMHRDLARRLLDRRAGGQPVGIHQHGFAHVNHEAVGRACEFGASRPVNVQRQDILAGQARLRDLLGTELDPVFTPPWNRCTTATGQALRECGIRTLSRDVTAGHLDLPGLDEWPISIDWFAKGPGGRLPRGEWARILADGLAAADAPIGIMLHHARMDRGELEDCNDLLRVLARHSRVRAARLGELGQQPASQERQQ